MEDWRVKTQGTYGINDVAPAERERGRERGGLEEGQQQERKLKGVGREIQM